MTAPISLVAKPTATEEVRASVIKVLQDALARAERGELESVVLILGSPAGGWLPAMSTTSKFAELIGRLEIAKQEFVLDFMKENGRA